MRPTERFAAYEQKAQVLEQIAKQYPEDSNEVAALKEAALALCFGLTKRYEEFQGYLAELNRPLTAQEENHLRELGLEP
ncbi:MAG: hypothetical protein WAK48_00685 [Candidatus Acidiferrum sp.]|jgi:hypothetical protein